MEKKDKLLKIIMLVSIIILIVIGALFYYKLNSQIYEQYQFYQYIGGRKVEYQGTLHLTRKKDVTELKLNDITMDLDSTPMYYKDEEAKILLPQNMAIVYPKDNSKMYKINHFSNISVNAYRIDLQSGELQKQLKNAFLYDGADLYVFLEETAVNVNGTEYILSPLSYIRVNYKQEVEIYNKQADEYMFFEKIEEDVIAKTESYSINMSLDKVERNGEEQLLIKSINYLVNEY